MSKHTTDNDPFRSLMVAGMYVDFGMAKLRRNADGEDMDAVAEAHEWAAKAAHCLKRAEAALLRPELDA